VIALSAMRRSVRVLVLLAAGCGERGGVDLPPGGADASVALDMGSVAEVGALADASPMDGAVPAMDAAAQLTAGIAAWTKYSAHLGQREAAYELRQRDCLGIPLSAQHPYHEDPDSDLQHPISWGRTAFDQDAADACLAAIQAASCNDIAGELAAGNSVPRPWIAGMAVCGRVIVGLVPPGGACLDSLECQSPQRYGCTSDPGRCGGHCQLAGTFGEAGADCAVAGLYCKEGLVCDADPLPDGPARCKVRGDDGAPCRNDDTCLPGFFCQRKTITDAQQFAVGACRRVQPGTACSGSWACPRSYACLGASPSTGGMCGAGRTIGQPCVVQAPGGYQGAFSDCAWGLRCVDIDGGGLRCFGGNPIGGSCGGAESPGRTAPWCADGYCDPAAGICRGPRSTGQTCSVAMTCAAPSECRVPEGSPAICIDPPKQQPLGGACLGNDSRECPFLSFCRPTALATGHTNGTCTGFRKAGESCTGNWNDCENADGCPERCEALTDCVNGVCVTCR
jgi:hypothetical protein